MIKWPEDLIEDIARKRCVIFLGAGTSMSCVGTDGITHPPSWKHFLELALDAVTGPKAHIQQLIKEADYLTACELLKSDLDGDWNLLLERCFVNPRFGHVALHEKIFKLDAKITLTQNFDKIYDTYAQVTSGNSVRVKSYTDRDVGSFLRGGQSIILKVHGSIDAPADMIFTRQEFASARHNHQSFYGMIEALAITHTFLFLGCSFSDPDVRLLFEKISYFHNSVRPHYICVAVERNRPHSDYLASMKRNLSLASLTYSPNARHLELNQSLDALLESVEARRRVMGSTLGW